MARGKAKQKSAPIRRPSTKEVSYGSYLKIPELLSLQQPLSEPVAHDELLFIITHQTYELWFKQAIFELQGILAALEADKLERANRLLNRLGEILRVLVGQIDILETMTPVDFNDFRNNLMPASGFQSQQFRELELLVGARRSDYVKFLKHNPEWAEKLKESAPKYNLHEAYLRLLRRKKLTRNGSDIQKGILKIYLSGNHPVLKDLSENLIGFDEQFMLWRYRHVQMVERMIGMKRGTGGSLGVAYLQQTLCKKFFPELWEARTEM